MTFESLGVRPEIVKALHALNIKEPTLIQEKSLKLIKEGHDIVGISKTGSGKTAAFGVPILDSLDMRKHVQVLIMAPTRELAVQIAKELEKFGKNIHLQCATVFGGVAIGPQIDRIKNSHIIVGTPGRLLDHLGRGSLDLSKIKTVVLDEADKMVDMGFIHDIRQILNECNPHRQILLFGATISGEIDGIKKNYMNDPKTIQGEPKVKEELLEQYYYNLNHRQKFSFLVHLLKKENSKRTMIFCSRRSTVELVAHNLKKQGIKVGMIHGKLTQNKRMQVMEQFNKDKYDVLVASTVAARGLHIEHVSHVINYDLSQDAEEYVHRVGRTARAGTSGKAITLLSEQDHDVFREILYRYDVKVKELEVEQFESLPFDTSSQSRGSSRGGYGRRPSYGGGHRGPNRSRGPQRSHSGPRPAGHNRSRQSGQARSYSGSRSSGSGQGSSRGRSSYGGRGRSGSRDPFSGPRGQRSTRSGGGGRRSSNYSGNRSR